VAVLAANVLRAEKAAVLRPCGCSISEKLRGEIMKSLMTCAGVLCVALVCLLAPEASALARAPQFMKTGGFLPISVVLGIVAACLVIGLVLRAFSKSPTDLSLNQRTK
jgi:hypothetical protein